MTKEEAMKSLAKTKVYVGEMREEVISKLLLLGFDVIGRNNINSLLDPEFLYITGVDFAGGKKLDVFFSHSYKQIPMSDILNIQIDPEFKDGDILANKYGNPFIFNGVYDSDGDLKIRLGLTESGVLTSDITGAVLKQGVHYATAEESAKFFKALSDAGKRWNAEKKCVENLPKEFKPFDKVLCRDRYDQNWTCDLYSHKDDDIYMTIGCYYKQCIPYEGNENLLGTSLPY